MYCPNCGTEITDDPKFCTNCGIKLSDTADQIISAPPTDDKRQWYYYKGKNKMGPVSTDDMKEYISRRAIARETMVWATGFADWVRADQTELGVLLQNTVPDLPAGCISEKWIWALATIPLVASIILPRVLIGMGIGSLYATIAVFVLNIVFLTADVKELKSAGKDAGSWLFLGVILVPVYIFVREGKTNKNYIPGVLWCVLFFASLIRW